MIHRIGSAVAASAISVGCIFAGATASFGQELPFAHSAVRFPPAAERSGNSFPFSLINFDDEGEDVIKRGEQGPGEPTVSADLSLADTVADRPIDLLPEDDLLEPIDSHFYLHHRAGGQIGQALPYTALGAFHPWNLDNGVAFGIGQLLLDNDGNVGGGLTLGRRWYHDSCNRVCGISGSYDIHRTRFQNTFQQFVLTLESRGDLWDFYANGYLPFSSRTRNAGLAISDNVRFQGNNLVRDIMDMSETPMGGLDVQVARRLGERNLWAYAGWYHFQGGGEQTYGASGGVHGYLLDRLAMDLTVSDDPLFGTNVGFSVTFFFGGASGGVVSPADVYSRMAEPLHRRDTAAINETMVVQTGVPLTAGGLPITVNHVDDGGIGTGTGTANDPFGSLTDAAGSATDIVYVHADSNFNGQQYALAANQRLLGEADGFDHMVQTDQLGLTTLPRATAGTNRPVIDNALGNAITAATNSEVSALDIRNAAGAAILADNTVNGPMNINRVAVSGGVGLEVINAAGDLRVSDIGIANTVGPGILLNNFVGGVTVDGGFISNSVGPGIAATDVETLLIQNLDIDNSPGPAIQIEVGGTNTTNATVQNNILFGNGAASSFGFAVNTGSTLNLNLFGNEDSVGFDLERDANGQLRLGGTIGIGGFFNDDNGNVANNGNTTGGGAPNVIISGAGNQIEIIDPLTIPTP